MLSNKWLIAGFAAAAVSTVSIYALMHKEDQAPQVAAVTWDQLYVPQTGDNDGSPAHAQDDAASDATGTAATPGAAAPDLPGTDSFKGPLALAMTTLDEAVQGALAGDMVGLHDLQNYFDAALGDEVELSRRARAVLQALGRTSLAADRAAMSDAAARVSDAVGRALASAYQLPLETVETLALPASAQGWDFGPEELAPADRFRRISASSPEVSGRALRAIGGSQGKAPHLLNDGLEGVDKFSTSLPDGYYRLVLLSAAQAGAGSANAPFGREIRSNGRPLRMVDGARVVPGAAARLIGTQVTVLSPAAPVGDDNLVAMLSAAGGAPAWHAAPAEGPMAGELLSLRVLVSDGSLTLEFAADAGEETYLVGLMVDDSTPDQLENDLENDIAALLSNTRPAAGDNGDAFQTPARGGQWAFSPAAAGPSATAGRGGPRGGSGGFGGGGGFSGGGGAPGSGGPGGGSGGENPGGGGNPGGSNPGGNPGGGNPGGNPGGGNPGGENPGGGNPGGGNPGGENPGGENPGGGNPGDGNPGDGDDHLTPPSARLAAKTDGDKVGRLGDSFTFDSCASLFNDDQLCSFTDEYLEENFEISWWLDGEKIGEGFLLEAATGERTLFQRAGDYVLTLEITYLSDVTKLWSSDQARLSLAAAQVAAPAGIGFILLGLGAILGRRRNRDR